MRLGKNKIEQVKREAAGRWEEIFRQLLPEAQLNRSAGAPCPGCGGTDRFKPHGDFKETGGVLCQNCFMTKNSDGIAAMRHYHKWGLSEAVIKIAEVIGVKLGQGKKSPLELKEGFDFCRPGARAMFGGLLKRYPTFTPEGIRRFGGIVGTYLSKPVFAFPAHCGETGKRIGYQILSRTGRNFHGVNGTDQGNKKQLYKGYGLLGMVDQIEGNRVHKVEGLSDAITLASQMEDAVVVTNGGTESGSMKNFPILAKASMLYICHDNDANGSHANERWSSEAFEGMTYCVVKLPNEVNDVRELFSQEGGNARYWQAIGSAEKHVGESVVKPWHKLDPESPEFLAHWNLDEYYQREGRKLIYWRGQWFKYKSHYEPVSKDELESDFYLVARSYFDKMFEKAPSTAGPKLAPPRFIESMIACTKSLRQQKDRMEPNTWMDARETEDTFYGFENGILNLSALLRGEDGFFGQKSPDFFSYNYFDYEFDEEASCPLWMDYLHASLGDDDKIRLAQEWMGYSLVKSNIRQKFMMLIGEGGNGKSVYLAGIEAMVGKHNKNSFELQNLGENFAMDSFTDKLVSHDPDVKGVNSLAEGSLKKLSAGDTVEITRKNKKAISVEIRSKVTVSANRLPNFRDKSDGLWRRLLILPFTQHIREEDKVNGMNESRFWENERPGILNWAIHGLFRLEMENEFTNPIESLQLKDEFRKERNPIIEYVEDRIEISEGSILANDELRSDYESWCRENGYDKKLGPNTLIREVRTALRKRNDEDCDGNGVTKLHFESVIKKVGVDAKRGTRNCKLTF